MGMGAEVDGAQGGADGELRSSGANLCMGAVLLLTRPPLTRQDTGLDPDPDPGGRGVISEACHRTLPAPCCSPSGFAGLSSPTEVPLLHAERRGGRLLLLGGVAEVAEKDACRQLAGGLRGPTGAARGGSRL